MKFILNADDFGLDSDTVEATIKCFENEGLTSATLMVNMPASELAFAYAREHPQFSFGIHLTYVADTVEEPVLPSRDLPSLTREDGRFKESDAVRRAALTGKLSIAEIIAETRAQLQKALDAGIRASHVDSHGHLHKFKPFQEALRQVLPEFGITKVRAVQNFYLKRPLKSPNFWLGPVWGAGIRKSFRTTDHFYMPTSAFETGWIEAFLKHDWSAAGYCEVGFHPGSNESWRAEEARQCLDFAKKLRQGALDLANWNDL